MPNVTYSIWRKKIIFQLGAIWLTENASKGKVSFVRRRRRNDDGKSLRIGTDWGLARVQDR